MDPYDKMLAAGPPEPPSMAVTVEYTVFARPQADSLLRIVGVMGGEGSWTSERDFEGWRQVTGSTLVEDVESYEAAEEIVQNLLVTYLSEVIDVENVVASAEMFEERDWDGIDFDRAKDERERIEVDRA